MTDLLQVSPMTERELLVILQGSHTGKVCMGSNASREVAQRMRLEGRRVSPYRCPFSRWTGGEHWHVGTCPNVQHLERIALAMRWANEHPGLEVPPALR